MLLCTFMQACKDKEEYEEEYTTLSAPTNVKAEQAEEGIKVSWDPVDGATQYYLYVKTANSNNFNKYDSTTDNYIVYKTDLNDSYGFYVCAYCSAYFYDKYGNISSGLGPQSETIYFTLDNPDNDIHVPTGLTAKQVKERIYISWDPVKTADKYMVEWSTSESTKTGTASSNEGFYIYNLTDGTKYSFRVRACRKNEYTQWSDPVSCTYSAPGGGSASGLYMGVIGFSDALQTKPITRLIYDNYWDNNVSSFKSFINNLVADRNTSIYYAVDNAINALENAEMPEDLNNVSIVTFTDGLDNTSTVNTQYDTQEAYRDAVKARILNTKIGRVPINAYSVGFDGTVSATDKEDFHNTLVAMASNDENAYMVSDMDEVNKTFKILADSLHKENKNEKLKLTIPSGLNSGTKMRFTFDVTGETPSDVAASKVYIEGTWRKPNILEDIEYHEVKTSSGKTLTGAQEEGKASTIFLFSDFDSSETLAKNVKFWYMKNKDWQCDIESTNAGIAESVIENRSAVVMLVLDCTTSLGENFVKMKNTATEFIDVLTTK